MSWPMRISKFPQIMLTGVDVHSVQPPQVPPTPPPPVGPLPVPASAWIPLGLNFASQLIFGKFTLVKTSTEGLGDILMGHDYGLPQMHQPCPPFVASPSILSVAFGASHKYFLPSYAVQETPHGGAIALAGASGSAVAISLPSFLITVQDCMDVMQVGFVAPTGLSTQAVSTRWVGFSGSDFLAGMIAMAGDAAGAAAGSTIGNKLTENMSAVGGIALGVGLNVVGNLAQTALSAHASGPLEGAVLGYALACTIVLAGAAPGVFAGKVADAVGGNERPNDRDPAFNAPPASPPPAAPPPVSSSGSSGSTNTGGVGGAGGAGPSSANNPSGAGGSGGSGGLPGLGGSSDSSGGPPGSGSSFGSSGINGPLF